MTAQEPSDRAPQYVGTSMRPPCCNCEGRGWELRYSAGVGLHTVCVVCNGTKVQPTQRGVAAARRSGRTDAMARAARRPR